MKTYKQHLITSKSFGEKLDLIKKPTFRSSAIFPVINNKFLETNIMFLGYWLIKRKILEVSILITLRNQKGMIIKRDTMIVDQIKSYKIAVKKMISNENNDFTYYESNEMCGYGYSPCTHYLRQKLKSKKYFNYRVIIVD